MSGTGWQLSGEYMESCNCDYLCPCIYTNPQARGDARALHRRADLPHRPRASRGDIDLDGLSFALVIRSGKVMADGDWVFAGVVDDEARTTPSAQALAAIVSGKAGGPPGMIRDNLVSDFRGVEFKPIDFTHRRPEARGVEIPDILSFEIEGVASRNRSGEPFYIDNTAHPAEPPARPGACQRKSTCRASGSTSTWWARATTAISRRSPGRPDVACDVDACRAAARPARALVIAAGAGRRDGARLALPVRRRRRTWRCWRWTTCPTWRCRKVRGRSCVVLTSRCGG